MDIKTLHNANEAAARLGHDLTESLKSAKEYNTPTLLLYSGGSALTVFEHLSPSVLGPYLTICAVDERFDEQATTSNAVTFMKTPFYDAIAQSESHFIDTHTHEGEDLGALTLRIRSSIDAWLTNNPNGNLFVILGIGTDGHTAGILPHPDDEHRFAELFLGPDHVTGYSTNDPDHPNRVTTTGTLLQHANHIWVYAVGAEKQQAIKQLFELPAHQLPAHLIKDLPGTIYTDSN